MSKDKKYCGYSTVWHFFVLLVLGLIIVGGFIYMWQVKRINYFEQQIAAQTLQMKNDEIAKYKKEITKLQQATTATTTKTTETKKGAATKK